MKHRLLIKFKAITIITILILSTSLLNGLPWWIFVLPILFFGSYIGIKKWNISTFPIGFLSGFLVWFFTNLYYSNIYKSVILDQMAQILTVNKIIVLFLSGIIGGLLTGLALLTGKHIVSRNQIDDL